MSVSTPLIDPPFHKQNYLNLFTTPIPVDKKLVSEIQSEE
jgi:hypothetical protein